MAVSSDPAAPPAGAARRPPAWAAILVVLAAAAAITVAAAWGIRGLLANPVRGTDAQGVTTLVGSFEPIDCGEPCIGYVQAGGRSAAVILPRGCSHPMREAQVRILGRLDVSRGAGTYRATGCAGAT